MGEFTAETIEITITAILYLHPHGKILTDDFLQVYIFVSAKQLEMNL
ncbi:MAG: hypothetical protein ABGY96_20170 [bacterium]